MIQEIILNDRVIPVVSYKDEKIDGLYKISIHFKVTSEDYHDIATLLYEGTFDVKVPGKDLSIRAAIQQYSTSITNLYEKDQIGDYYLTLIEVKRG